MRGRVLSAGYWVGKQEKRWITTGKGASARTGRWTGADRGAGGPGEWQGTIPTIATAPETRTRRNRWQEPLANKVTEGGKGGGVKPKWEGGIDGRK